MLGWPRAGNKQGTSERGGGVCPPAWAAFCCDTDLACSGLSLPVFKVQNQFPDVRLRPSVQPQCLRFLRLPLESGPAARAGHPSPRQTQTLFSSCPCLPLSQDLSCVVRSNSLLGKGPKLKCAQLYKSARGLPRNGTE